MAMENDFELIGELIATTGLRRQPTGHVATGATLSGQIAILLKYLIATNASRPGTLLPGLREGSKVLGVNLHTLRRAYQILEEDGYASITPSIGARVSKFAPGLQAPKPSESFDQFLDRITWEARKNFGISDSELAAILLSRTRKTENVEAYFYECTAGQAAMHATQTAQIIEQPCHPVVYTDDAPAPRGFSVATLFHLDDIDRLWPGARDQFHFVHINIAEKMAKRVSEISANSKQIVIWESDEVLGHRIARDLAHLSRCDPSMFEVKIIAGDEHENIERAGINPIMITPRIWNRLPEEIKAHENKEQILYDIEPDDARKLSDAFTHFKLRCRALSGLNTEHQVNQGEINERSRQ